MKTVMTDLMIPTHSITHSLTFTMMKIYVYFCLLSGLSVVQMKPLNINGRVGESVTISCSDWNVWADVTENVKSFCYSPCTEDHHIIIKAAYGKIKNKNRIKLHNKGKTLFVTSSKLQKSDSKTYYCGVERFGPDAYIEVNLKVTDAPSPPSMTPQTVIVFTTSSFAVTKSSTMSSNSSDVITDTSTSYTTFNTPPDAPAQGSVGFVLYLVIGVVVIIILMVSLKLVNKRMKRRLNVVSGADAANRDAQEGAGPNEVYQSLHPLMMDKDQVYSTITPNKREGPSTSPL